MKNTPHTQNLSKRHQSENRAWPNDRVFPEIGPHFQPATFTGGCGKPAKFEHPAFSEISKDYFAYEEPRSFAAEAAIFTALIALAVLPIINSVQAIALLHTIGVL